MVAYHFNLVQEMVVRDHPSHLYLERHPNLFMDQLMVFTLVVGEVLVVIQALVDLAVVEPVGLVEEQQELTIVVVAVQMVLVVEKV